MQRILLVIVLTAILGGLAGVLTSWLVESQHPYSGIPEGGLVDPLPTSKLEIGKTQFDFGTVLGGAQGTHQFTITNIGDGPLQLEVARETCSCTVGKFLVEGKKDLEKEGVKDVRLKPGQHANLVVEWSARDTGAFRETIVLATSDPDRLQLQLQVSGTVLAPLVVQPPLVEFFPGDAKVVKKEVFLLNLWEERLVVPPQKGVWANEKEAARFDYTLRPLTKEELAGKAALEVTNGYLLTIQMREADKVKQSFTQRLTLPTTAPKQRSFIVPIFCASSQGHHFVGSEFNPLTGVWQLGKLNSEQTRTYSLQLLTRGATAKAVPQVQTVQPKALSGATITITPAVEEVDPLRITTTTSQPETKTWDLRLTLPAGLEPGQYEADAKITITTGLKASPEWVLPLQLQVDPSP